MRRNVIECYVAGDVDLAQLASSACITFTSPWKGERNVELFGVFSTK